MMVNIIIYLYNNTLYRLFEFCSQIFLNEEDIPHVWIQDWEIASNLYSVNMWIIS